MAEPTGHFLVIDRPRIGSGFEVALWGHHLGRLFAVACLPTYDEATQAAAAEAEQRGGYQIEDRIRGQA